MTGDDLIVELKRRGEFGSYLTFDGYEFLRSLRSSREIYLVLQAWGADGASETDGPARAVDHLIACSDGRVAPLMSRFNHRSSPRAHHG